MVPPVFIVSVFIFLWSQSVSIRPHEHCKCSSPCLGTCDPKICAGKRDRTFISGLEVQHNCHYTIPALIRLYLLPTHLIGIYQYRLFLFFYSLHLFLSNKFHIVSYLHLSVLLNLPHLFLILILVNVFYL